MEFVMQLAKNEHILTGLNYLSLHNEPHDELTKMLETEQQMFAAILLLVERLHNCFGGQFVIPIIQSTFSHPISATQEQWRDFGVLLIHHAMWKELEGLANALHSQFPEISAYLRISLHIEKNESEIAQILLNTIDSASLHTSMWQNLCVRLALLSPQTTKEYLVNSMSNESIGLVLKARVALALNLSEQGSEFLRQFAALKNKPNAEALWLEGVFGIANIPREHVLQCWEKALAIRPRFAACLYSRGKALLHWGDVANGEADCTLALDIKPWAGQIALDLAQSKVKQKKHLSALNILDNTLIINENQPDVIAYTIDVLRFLGKVKEAEALANKAISRYHENAGIWLAYGTLLQSIGKKLQAMNAYRQIKKESVLHYVAVRNNLARLLLDEGDVDAAVMEWEEAIKIDKQNVEVAINLAYAYRQRGDNDEAESLFDWILETNRTNADALRGKSGCLRTRGNLVDALSFAESAKNQAPNDVRSYSSVAKVKVALLQIGEAISTLQAGLDKVEKPQPLIKELFSILMQKHEYQHALDLVSKAINQYPDEVEFVLLAADALNAQNRFEECLALLHKATTIDIQRGGWALVVHLRSRNRYTEALNEARQLLERLPDVLRHYGLVAEILYKMERHDEAIRVLERGVALDPERVSINKQLVGQLLAQENYVDALLAAQRFLNTRRSNPQFLLCIEVLKRSRQFDEAYLLSEDYLLAEPLSVTAYLTAALAAERVKKVDRAIAILQQGLVHYPVNVSLNRILIVVLLRNERFVDCENRIQLLLQSSIGKIADMIVVGVMALIEIGRHDDAKNILESARQTYKEHRGIYGALYTLYRRMGHHDVAEKLLAKTLDIFPEDNRNYQWLFDEHIKYHKLHAAKSVILRWETNMPGEWSPLFAKLVLAEKNRKTMEIIEIADYMLSKWPDEAVIYSKLASAFSEIWSLPRAIDFAKKAVEIRPNEVQFLRQLLSTLVKAGDFDSFDELFNRLEKQLGDKRYVFYASAFFFINCHPYYSKEQIFNYYKWFGQRGVTPNLPPSLEYKNSKDPNRVLRIGYISPDFREHAVAYFTEGWLKEHDRQQFELFAFAAFEPDQQDDVTIRFKSYFHHWIDISSFSEDELNLEVRKHEIDLLIDLAGHTQGSRLFAMARKPAPIQASSVIGAGQTTGFEQIDYLIADSLLIPKDFEKFCTEKVARVNWIGYPYIPSKKACDMTPLPFLKNHFITFASFARPIRLSKNLFSIWAKILNALPNAKLRLDHMPYAELEIQTMLIERYQSCGGNPQQLVFANTRPHWQAFADVDIVLDTFPTGSATTAVESLWMGVPVITLDSRPLMGRFTLVQVHALDLQETCVAANEDEYISKALMLAADIELLNNLRFELRERFIQSPMMNYKGHSVEVAKLYRQIWHDWCQR